uniref:Geranylgeranyl diphosphate reductase, chloroplastic n=1 Tax=Rhizochromulina marina TaxID=1034831 RepID=A0A7S2WEE7_9STRA|mmetsp:Transcript_22583/g.65677  ORF Transcript_22583/g.65677 Transcript_22583/m.65677 type:complete len:474 (+) Transcript_22583:35-1456(+)
MALRALQIVCALAALAHTAQALVPTRSLGASRTSVVAPRRHAVSTRAVVEAKYKVAVIGGGPSGACAAEIFAQEPNIETVLIERKMDNCKPCGGAIPLCMVDEFKLPDSIIDRKVRKMKMISPTNREVDIGQTLAEEEYIGMTRREVLDAYLRDRAVEYGATAINGLVTQVDVPDTADGKYKIHYANYAGDKRVGTAETLDVDLIVGADGANSRVAKAIGAGEYNYAIAFQERIKIDDEKMAFYEDLAEMYVGDDVSPDFYGWVFPKYDHVGVGTGTVVNRPGIKDYQKAIRDRAGEKIAGGKIIKVEAHPIPEHMRPRRVVGRVALVGDAAGYVTKCSGEGIYFAAKSGRMAAESICKLMEGGSRLPTEKEIKDTYIQDYDRAYGPTYTVLDILQKVFYSSNGAREAFVDMCDSEYVQKVTFDSYLYKKVQGNNPVEDIKLLIGTIGSLIRGSAIAPPDKPFYNPEESLKRL